MAGKAFHLRGERPAIYLQAIVTGHVAATNLKSDGAGFSQPELCIQVGVAEVKNLRQKHVGPLMHFQVDAAISGNAAK